MNIRYLFIMTIATFIPFLSACQDDTNAIKETKMEPTAIADTSNPPGVTKHQEACAGCHMIKHDAAFYQRSNRKMDSYERLQSQVRLCNANLDLQLFDEDMTIIGEYLNESYYKFPMN